MVNKYSSGLEYWILFPVRIDWIPRISERSGGSEKRRQEKLLREGEGGGAENIRTIKRQGGGNKK